MLNPTELNFNMRLTDLNIDCLETILEHLKLGDLLNVADANKRLHRAACSTFVEKYHEESATFELIRYSQKRLLQVYGD